MRYRFGDFLFDPARGLSRAGEAIELEPRASDLLRYLLEHSERVVSREELAEHVWDGKIVTDAAIRTQIRSVRKALSDDADQKKFIKTHPRRGFSFLAPVEKVNESASTEVPTPPGSTDRVGTGQQQPISEPLNPFSGRRRIWIGLGFIAIAAVLITSLSLWRHTSKTSPSQREARSLSIVVLPFDNLSGDSQEDYLADAFTEDLIIDLSRIRDAFVISRSTSFTYRGKDLDAATVSKDLGVRYVLEGSLRIEGNKVRINAQLIDGENNSHLWAHRFDQNLDDLLSVQDSVTGRIASVLRAELRKVDDKRQDPVATQNAWDYALRGNVLLYNHQSVTDYQEAYANLTKAVTLDPGISSAWVGLAFIHFVASLAPIPEITRPDSAELALKSALKATKTNPMNAEPYWLVGAGYARTGRPELGMPACQTAIDLNPNMDCGHVCAGLVHMAMGEPDKAIPYFKYALELNPRFRPFTKEKYLGLAYIQSGHYDLAIAALNRALATAPKDGFANLAISAALALEGQTDKAKGALAKHLERDNGRRPSLDSLRRNLAWLGPGIERLLTGLQRAGLS